MTSFEFRHGGYRRPSTIPARDDVVFSARSLDVSFPFTFMFPDLQQANSLLPSNNSSTVITNLKALGEAMITVRRDDPAAQNSRIPPIYTYLGQFIDHDITHMSDQGSGADIFPDDTFTPLRADVITQNFINTRRPVFDLDSVYGDGPAAGSEASQLGFYESDGVRLRVGENPTRTPALTPDPQLDNDRNPPARDLRRRGDNRAIIGDSRNDENTIISQLHLGFIKFHNAVADDVERRERLSGSTLFERAQQLVQWHYQWLVVNDYLRTITTHGMVDEVLYGMSPLFTPDRNVPAMPLEFSFAAYRFGHTMVRDNYDFNQNFGRADNGAAINKHATFQELFQFTGNRANPNTSGPGVPNNWIIEWDRFTDHHSPFDDRFARKIDTELAFALSDMQNEVDDPNTSLDIQALQKHLAQRNLLRGYLMSIPTGQAIANAVRAPQLSGAELVHNNPAVEAVLRRSGFIERTPLWYYILKESEVRQGGECLGDVGSRIVAETIIGLIRSDPNSYMNQMNAEGKPWTPRDGVKLPGGRAVVDMMGLLEFAGVAAQPPALSVIHRTEPVV